MVPHGSSCILYASFYHLASGWVLIQLSLNSDRRFFAETDLMHHQQNVH